DDIEDRISCRTMDPHCEHAGILALHQKSWREMRVFSLLLNGGGFVAKLEPVFEGFV
ncbi:unnamed protein product, partial [Allacma fusca]